MALAAGSYHSGTEAPNGEGRSGKQFTGKKRDQGQLELRSIVTKLRAYLSESSKYTLDLCLHKTAVFTETKQT